MNIESFGGSIAMKYLSLSNQQCHARPTNFDLNFNENSNIDSNINYSVSVDQFGGNCNTIDDTYARICVPNKVKDNSVKVFDLMSEVNETEILLQHESCECTCRLNESGWNSKQKWFHDDGWCECKELDDWSSCKDDYIWNPSKYDYKCNKACKICEYLGI